MATTMPDIFKISVDASAVSAAKTELKARHHRIVVDEPRERGGTDTAATPLETLLSSYLACTNVIANFIARQKNIELEGLDMSLVCDFDTRGVFEKADVRVPFPNISVEIRAETSATDAQLALLSEEVARRCPVSVILREAGCQIDDKWVRV